VRFLIILIRCCYPGGQTGSQPISLDAIDQIQVATAPYDVTLSGFTSVNAVTKSGTNEFHGTTYAFFRNQDLTGSKINGENIFVPSLEHKLDLVLGSLLKKIILLC
jgi:hypothetical protein